MKNILLFIMVLFAGFCHAQVSVTIPQLKDTKWVQCTNLSNYETCEYIFTDTTMCLLTYYMLDPRIPQVDLMVFRYPYYLSNEVPEEFDFSKVGQLTSGMYIIYYNDKLEEMYYYTITSFDTQSMSLFNKIKAPETKIDAKDLEFYFVKQKNLTSHGIKFCEVCCQIDESTKTAKVVNFEEYHLTDWKNGCINFPTAFKVEEKEYTITSIKDSAFMDCHDVKRAIIPSSVKNIGKYAFLGCKNLKSVQLPLGLSTIEEGSFLNCEKLDSVIVPSSVAHIKAKAFAGCNKLSTIMLPAYLESLDNSVFSGCSALTAIECRSKTVPQVSPRTFNGINKWLCTIYVPSGSVDKYKAAEGWKDYKIEGRYYPENTIDWCVMMQNAYKARLEIYERNYFLHLLGPNGGYNVWLPAENGNNSASVQPTPNSSALSNNQGFRLSIVFAKDPLEGIYQRALALGMNNQAEYSMVNGTNDSQIQSMFAGIRYMAGSMLFMSTSEANAYVQKLYNAFVNFKNNRATSEDLVILCGGCTDPRFAQTH